MILLPWLVVIVGVSFMIWQGYSDKRKYLLEQAQLEEKAKIAQQQASEKPAPRETVSPTAA